MNNTTTTNDEYAGYNGIRSETDRLLNNAQVQGMISFGRTWIHNAVREGVFPSPVSIGQRRLWRESEIRNWIAQL